MMRAVQANSSRVGLSARQDGHRGVCEFRPGSSESAVAALIKQIGKRSELESAKNKTSTLSSAEALSIQSMLVAEVGVCILDRGLGLEKFTGMQGRVALIMR